MTTGGERMSEARANRCMRGDVAWFGRLVFPPDALAAGVSLKHQGR
jgi:hypothetical protein